MNLSPPPSRIVFFFVTHLAVAVLGYVAWREGPARGMSRAAAAAGGAELEWKRERDRPEDRVERLRRGDALLTEALAIHARSGGAVIPEKSAPRLVDVAESMAAEGDDYDRIRALVFRVMSDRSTDWEHVFRHGAVTVEELEAMIRQAAPELAARVPEAVPEQLFGFVAAADPPAAMRLLDHLQEDDRWFAMVNAVSDYFRWEDPRTALETLRRMPAGVGDGIWEERLRVWRSRTPRDVSFLSRSYFQWLEEQPDGPDRQMIICALAELDPQFLEGQGIPAGKLQQMKDGIRDPRLLGEMRRKEGR